MSEVIDAHNFGIAGGYIIEAAMQGDIDQLKAENDKLREYVTKLEAANLDVTARLTDYIGQYDPTDAFVAEVKAENAKLRGLLEAVLQCAGETKRDKGCDACPMYNGPWRNDGTWCLLRPTLRELGVEVDG